MSKGRLQVAIVTAAFVFLAVIIWWEAKRCETARDECPTQTLPVPLLIPANDAESNPTPDSQKEKSCYRAKCYLCCVLTTTNLPSIYLILIGAGGILAAFHTLKAIERQGEIMINIERAWVMVEVEPVPGAGPICDGEVEVRDIRAGNTTYNARITCKNDGKSPAWITEKFARLDIVADIPEIPDWQRIEPIKGELEPLSAKEVGKPRDESLTCKRPREDGKTVILYGVVNYRDIFGCKRTTSFGYKVRDDGVLKRLHQPKYNENT
jgi:hypothetical protein